jgi:predicted DNA-binding transcriptional regulator YafY
MNKTERIFKIEQLIAARKVVSFAELLHELEVSRATLKRDLEYLRSRMKTPITYDREANGCHFGRKRGETERVEFPGLWFNASEAAALLTMQHLLEDLQPGLLMRHVEPLEERLKSLLESADHSFQEIKRRVRILHSGRRVPQLKFFEVAASTLLNRRQLQIAYHSRATNETTLPSRTSSAISPGEGRCRHQRAGLGAGISGRPRRGGNLTRFRCLALLPELPEEWSIAHAAYS